MCTFVFVQQGQSTPIHVGWNGERSGIQFVDDSHVPHNPSAAYFVDNYGGRQNYMTVNRGDQGTMLSTNKSALPGNTHLAAAQQQQVNQAAPGCNTPQTANNPACKLNNKINNATNNVNNSAAAVAAPVSAVKQLGDTLGGLFRKPAPAPAANPPPPAGQ